MDGGTGFKQGLGCAMRRLSLSNSQEKAIQLERLLYYQRIIINNKVYLINKV